MLEIPASNGGEYREYLVSHETLQERPRLRLPVCGETAVPSLFQPTPARSFHPPFLSLFLLLFRSPFINYNEPGEGGNKPVKNPIIAESSASAFILFPFNLPRCLTANQMYLEYRCLWCAEFAIFLNQPGKKVISCSCSPKFITHSVCLISRKLSDRMAIRIDFEGKKLMRWKGNELKYQI